MVTKSGTNQYHGNAFEFFRNSALNANDYFLKQSGGARPELNSNQFGGTLGGPIKKDKSFFFISYQGTRQHNGASANSLTTLFIPQGLTNDRSTATLQNFALANYGVTTVDPTALALLQAVLPMASLRFPVRPRTAQFSTVRWSLPSAPCPPSRKINLASRSTRTSPQRISSRRNFSSHRIRSSRRSSVSWAPIRCRLRVRRPHHLLQPRPQPDRHANDRHEPHQRSAFRLQPHQRAFDATRTFH